VPSLRDSVPLLSTYLGHTFGLSYGAPFGAVVGWCGAAGLSPADSRGRPSPNEFNVKIPTLVAQNATRMGHPRELGLGLADCTDAAGECRDPSARKSAGLRMTRVVELRIGIVAVPADSVPLSSSLPRTYLRAIVWRPFGAGVGWATRGLRPADSRGRLSLHEFNVKIPTLVAQNATRMGTLAPAMDNFGIWD